MGKIECSRFSRLTFPCWYLCLHVADTNRCPETSLGVLCSSACLLTLPLTLFHSPCRCSRAVKRKKEPVVTVGTPRQTCRTMRQALCRTSLTGSLLLPPPRPRGLALPRYPQILSSKDWGVCSTFSPKQNQEYHRPSPIQRRCPSREE